MAAIDLLVFSRPTIAETQAGRWWSEGEYRCRTIEAAEKQAALLVEEGYAVRISVNDVVIHSAGWQGEDQ